MKKHLLTATRVILFAMLPILLAAQCSTPTPNEPEIEFISEPAITIETPLGSGCFTTFEWSWRTTPLNGGEVEIYIGAISRSGNCTTEFDAANLIHIAKREIIVDIAPWKTRDGGAGHTINEEIPSYPARSKTIYRLLFASCYSEIFLDTKTGNITRTPCDNGNNGRCKESWRICWEILPDGITKHLNEALVGIVKNSEPCPGTTNNTAGQPIPCLRICE